MKKITRLEAYLRDMIESAGTNELCRLGILVVEDCKCDNCKQIRILVEEIKNEPQQ